MAEVEPGTVVYKLPSGIHHQGGHSNADFVCATKQEDGTWQVEYKNGDTFIAGRPEPPPGPPEGYSPDTSTADHDNPWTPDKGNDPPLPDPPSVPGGTDHPGKDVEVIDVDAIKYYAKSLRALLPVVTDAIKELDDFASAGFGAGNFGAAGNLKIKVFGGRDGNNGSTLLASTRQVFVAAETVITEVSARCDEIAQKYKTAAELSKLDAAELNRMIDTVKTKVGSLPLGAAS